MHHACSYECYLHPHRLISYESKVNWEHCPDQKMKQNGWTPMPCPLISKETTQKNCLNNEGIELAPF